jgi:hypothetical protein
MKIHLIPDDNFKDILEVTVDAGEATNVEEAIDAFAGAMMAAGYAPESVVDALDSYSKTECQDCCCNNDTTRTDENSGKWEEDDDDDDDDNDDDDDDNDDYDDDDDWDEEDDEPEKYVQKVKRGKSR